MCSSLRALKGMFDVCSMGIVRVDGCYAFLSAGCSNICSSRVLQEHRDGGLGRRWCRVAGEEAEHDSVLETPNPSISRFWMTAEFVRRYFNSERSPI